MELINLVGVHGGKKQCLFIKVAKDIEVILNNDLAATCAFKNGALNIYKTDDGFIQCQAMRNLQNLESRIYTDIKDVIMWTNTWLPKIK